MDQSFGITDIEEEKEKPRRGYKTKLNGLFVFVQVSLTPLVKEDISLHGQPPIECLDMAIFEINKNFSLEAS